MDNRLLRCAPSASGPGRAATSPMTRRAPLAAAGPRCLAVRSARGRRRLR